MNGNFSDNANEIGSRLSSIQQRQEMGMENQVGIQGAKWDTILGQDANAESKDTGDGGVETGGGLTSSVIVAGVKKVVKGRIKGALRDAVQKKIDQVKADKASNDVETNDPAPSDAPARTQADLNYDNVNSGSDLRPLGNNLNSRLNNMDKASRQSVKDDFNAEKAPEGGDLTAKTDNVKLMEQKVQAREQDPATKFQDENFDANPPTAPDVPTPPTQPTTTPTTTQPVRTQAQDDAQLGGDDDDDGGGQSGANLTRDGGANDPVQPAVDDAVSDLSDSANNISQKGMDALTDKLGVDFGDLSAEDLGSSLVSAVGESAGSMLGGLGGLLGSALDFLGPIGMLVGVGTTIYGLTKDAQTESDSASKQTNLDNLTANINDLGGMSYGSIASTPMDTTQVRGGGASLNF